MTEEIKKRPEILPDVINGIEEPYRKRQSTQADLAKKVNAECGTNLTTKDVASVTKQEGYHHGIKKDEKKTVMLILNESFRDHVDDKTEHK